MSKVRKGKENIGQIIKDDKVVVLKNGAEVMNRQKEYFEVILNIKDNRRIEMRGLECWVLRLKGGVNVGY